MRRMLSDAQVKYLRNKQDKLIAGNGITISDSNVISASVPVPQYTNVLTELPALSAGSYTVFSDITLVELNGCKSFTITLNVGAGIWLSSTFSGSIISDISAPVGIDTTDGQILLVIEENSSTLYNNTQTTMINEIIIDKWY